MHIVSCGVDIAKNVFQLYGIDEEGNELRRRLQRNQMLHYFNQLEPCLVGVEACGGAHYWARELGKLGHTVRLIAPQKVKPYVQGNKTDANDAEGIHAALLRPGMKLVSPKTTEQQDLLMLHRIRSLTVKTRTALVNQIRGLLAEYGVVLPKRVATLRRRLVEVLAEDERVSIMAREQLHGLYEELLHQDDRIKRQEALIHQACQSNPACRRLLGIPGVGPLTATALVASAGDVSVFRNGREFAAWLGIVPRQHSSGDKTMLQGISKRGDAYLRTLLVHGARAVLSRAKGKEDRNSQWLVALEARRGYNKACVAQANKTARIAWALLRHESTYQLAA